MIAQLLTACYLLGLAAALLKACRYAVDYLRREQWFYLVGVPANLALAAALALLIVSTGADPVIPAPALRILLRVSFMAWAILGLLFEVLYLRSFLRVKNETDLSE